MPTRGTPEDHLPLKTHVFEILLCLVEEARHGYAIVQAVEARVGRRLEAGNLYRTLRTLLEQGWIEEREAPEETVETDRRRRYFHLTDRGHRLAKAEAERLERLVQAARHRRLLDGVTSRGGAR